MWPLSATLNWHNSFVISGNKLLDTRSAVLRKTRVKAPAGIWLRQDICAMKRDWAMIGYQKVMTVKLCVVSIQTSTKFHDSSQSFKVCTEAFGRAVL